MQHSTGLCVHRRISPVDTGTQAAKKAALIPLAVETTRLFWSPSHGLDPGTLCLDSFGSQNVIPRQGNFHERPLAEDAESVKFPCVIFVEFYKNGMPDGPFSHHLAQSLLLYDIQHLLQFPHQIQYNSLFDGIHQASDASSYITTQSSET